ncbi:alcohol dehydrogenase [Salix suchowensis]|nr:alcohol dehydrogenase [Salix suchowensis]
MRIWFRVVGLGATLNVAKPKKGSTVAIFGLGAVGLAAAEGARISGASRIIGVDLNANRFDEAKKFGVTEFVNPKDHDKPVHEVIAEMTNGGVDRSVECTGSGWGVAVLVGVPNKDDAFKTHPMNILNEKTLKVVEKYMNKELELEKFITHEVPFAEINKAFEFMLSGAGLRLSACSLISQEEHRQKTTQNRIPLISARANTLFSMNDQLEQYWPYVVKFSRTFTSWKFINAKKLKVWW